MSNSTTLQPADLQLVRDSYDRVADNYARMVATDGMGDIRQQPWLRAAIDVFADVVGDIGPLLDVGCGPGTVTAYLHERGVDVSGVDLSPRMIANAKRLHPQCRFEVGSWTDIELPEDTYGGILAWWSLFNLPRRVVPQVFSRCARALQPGGQLIIATHAGDEDVTRTEAYGGIPVQWTTHRWRPDPLATHLEDAGLRTTALLNLPSEHGAGPVFVIVGQRDA